MNDIRTTRGMNLVSAETVDRIGRRIIEEEALRNIPAQDQQIAQVWQVWCACPSEMQSYVRRLVLENEDDALPYAEARPIRLQLRERFACLPFGPEFNKALDTAEVWHEWTDRARLMRGVQAPMMRSQLAFGEVDTHGTWAVGLCRADRELSLADPKWFDKTPTVEAAAHLQARQKDYQLARERSLKLLDGLLYPARLLKKYGIQRGEPVDWMHRAYGVPHPPKDIPHYVFIARLDALGICREGRMTEFCLKHLHKLKRNERQDFYNLSLTAKFDKSSRLAPLAVWLVDNTPVFHRKWTRDEVWETMKRHGLPLLSNPTQLRSQIHKWKIRCTLLKAPSTLGRAGFDEQKSLVTPAPCFTGLLGNS